MSSITLDIIPEQFKQDRNIAPFIVRSIELESANPVVSYYCKIYVLEYIFNGKLHVDSKETESFAVTLLEDIERIRNNEEDEALHKVLSDKNLSISVVLTFAYKLFNSCLESVSNYKGYEKVSLAQKMRATLNFLQVLSVFTGNEEFDIDYAKLTGGKASTPSEFEILNKEKIKIIKFQLTRLIKDEIPIKDDDQELEDELNQELENFSTGTEKIEGDNEELSLPGVPGTAPHSNHNNDLELSTFDDENSIQHIAPPDGNDIGLPSAPTFINDSSEPLDENNGIGSTSPSFENQDGNDAESTSDHRSTEVNLPGAPHFSPDDSNEVKLPGVPKFLPDEDITHINKSSFIKVFPPGKLGSLPPKAEVPKPELNPINSPREHITRESIDAIIDKNELIAKIQKHSKFAISALNYEDLKTAEDELTKALDLLKLVKQQEQA